MPNFSKGPNFRTPFGRNQFLRSTQDVKTESYTCSASATPFEEIDGETQKVLQPGTVMAKITSGEESGKIGPFQAGVSDGRQTLANIVGICNTFLPWQLLNRDVEIAVVVDARVVQEWCFEYDEDGVRVELTNTTAAALNAEKGLNILFQPASTVVE